MPHYTHTHVFVNDFSAVRDDQPPYAPAPAASLSAVDGAGDGGERDGVAADFLLQAQAVTGRCYVITFSPAHNRTLADLLLPALHAVIATWTALYAAHLPPSHRHYTSAPPELWAGVSGPKEQYSYLQIFENKGAAMGCSNPHPHGQAWCTSSLPSEVTAELHHLAAYKRTHPTGRGLLADYAALELRRPGERVVFANATWVALVPWWAVWPFEILAIPLRPVPSLPALTAAERDGLAQVLSQVTKRYDNLFNTHFPYSMGIHQAPLCPGPGYAEDDMHMHLHFYPPLLRSATVRKFLVGCVAFPNLQSYRSKRNADV